MTKLIYRKENKGLIQTVKQYAEPKLFYVRMTEIIITMSTVKVPEKMDRKFNIVT